MWNAKFNKNINIIESRLNVANSLYCFFWILFVSFVKDVYATTSQTDDCMTTFLQ
jgi:hypothetical protein